MGERTLGKQLAVSVTNIILNLQQSLFGLLFSIKISPSEKNIPQHLFCSPPIWSPSTIMNLIGDVSTYENSRQKFQPIILMCKKYFFSISLTQIESDSWLHPHIHQLLCDVKNNANSHPKTEDLLTVFNHSDHHSSHQYFNCQVQSIPMAFETLHTNHRWAKEIVMKLSVVKYRASIIQGAMQFFSSDILYCH